MSVSNGTLNGAKLQEVAVKLIDPSPFQPRKHFDEESLKRLGETIRDDGLIQPIVVRQMNGRFELVAGERRVRGARLVGVKELLARVANLDDHTARKMALWENLHREDLSPVEEACGIVDWVDACLGEEEVYRDGGKTPVEKVRKLLGTMAGDENNKTSRVINKVVNKVKQAFSQLRRKTDWQAFYNHDLPMVEELLCDDQLFDVAVEEGLNKEQAKALVKLKKKAPKYFKDVIAKKEIDVGVGEKSTLKDASAREIQWAARDHSEEKPTLFTEIPKVAARSPELLAASADALPIEDATVDIIITSPPYNIGPKGGSKERRRGGKSSGGRAWEGIGYETKSTEGEYQDWQLCVLAELFRVARDGASLFYNHKVRQQGGKAIHPMEWLFKAEGWVLRQEIIWDRGSTHNHEPSYFWPHDERIYWLTKGKPTLPDKPINQPTVWQFHGPVADTWHPSPFSDELPRRCLEAVGRPGCTVMDPFGGSMTTCRVALNWGAARVIGCDINEETIARAAKENGWKFKP